MRRRGCAWQGAWVAAGHVWRGEGAWVAGETATAADYTHSTGMHSCLLSLIPSWKVSRSKCQDAEKCVLTTSCISSRKHFCDVGITIVTS